MGKRSAIIIGIIGLLIIVILIVVAVISGKSNQASNEPTALASIKPGDVPNSDRIVVSGVNSNVETNNFLRKANAVTPERVDLRIDPSIGIVYSQSDATFYITISAADVYEFSRKRIEAENILLEDLGISSKQACLLKVQIRTVTSDDPEISDKIFPLNGCGSN